MTRKSYPAGWAGCFSEWHGENVEILGLGSATLGGLYCGTCCNAMMVHVRMVNRRFPMFQCVDTLTPLTPLARDLLKLARVRR